MPVELLRRDAVAVVHVRRRVVTYSRFELDSPVVIGQIERRVEELGQLPPTVKPTTMELGISDYVMVVRFYFDGLLCVVVEPAVRDRFFGLLWEMKPEEIRRIGGGLSDHSVIDLTTASEAETAELICTHGKTAEFLNDAFEFLFARRRASERLTMAKLLTRSCPFTFDSKTMSFRADSPSARLSRTECEELDRRFAAIIRNVEMPLLDKIEVSPVSDPPWARALRIAGDNW
jgi:hypothetical protein